MGPIGLAPAPAAGPGSGAGEQHRLEHAVGERLRQGPGQAGSRSPFERKGDGGARDADGTGDRPVGGPTGVLEAQDLSETSHRHSLGWHRVLLVKARRSAVQPSSRAIATHKAAGFILETVADIKSESMAGFSSESLAEIARNQHARRPRGRASITL